MRNLCRGRRSASAAVSALSRLRIAVSDFAANASNRCAQLVERLVVERNIGHDGHARRVKRDRAVALVHFADEDIFLANHSACKRQWKA